MRPAATLRGPTSIRLIRRSRVRATVAISTTITHRRSIRFRFLSRAWSQAAPSAAVRTCRIRLRSRRSNAWTDSFLNIQCYDTLKVNAVLNQIHGKTHDGLHPAPVPTIFGMNFQAVSVGQKLIEKSLTPTVKGGYLDSQGTPSPALLGEIQFVDASIGKMVSALKSAGCTTPPFWSSPPSMARARSIRPATRGSRQTDR